MGTKSSTQPASGLAARVTAALDRQAHGKRRTGPRRSAADRMTAVLEYSVGAEQAARSAPRTKNTQRAV